MRILHFCTRTRYDILGAESIYVTVPGSAVTSQQPLVALPLPGSVAEGLGCVLTTLLCMDEAEIKELLQIPDPWGTAAAIPIGYPVLGGHGPISRRPLSKLAFGDTWGEALFEEST